MIQRCGKATWGCYKVKSRLVVALGFLLGLALAQIQEGVDLLSEESGFITGQAIYVDGGRSVAGPVWFGR